VGKLAPEGAVVKISWTQKKGRWTPYLKTVDKNGYKHHRLTVGEQIEFELTDRRRCTGYHTGIGRMKPCPEYREIEKGSQCTECRQKDVYTGYIEGRSPAKIKAEFTVYLAQSGPKTKVGVTRTNKTHTRWVEQGADYAVPIKQNLTSQQALKLEQKISRENPGITQTIRKEHKLHKTDSKIERYKRKLDIKRDITDLQEKIGYPDTIGRKLMRKGRFSGKIHAVKGQIISNGDLCIAMSSGKEIGKPSQTALTSYR